jgi:hypothetical protein
MICRASLGGSFGGDVNQQDKRKQSDIVVFRVRRDTACKDCGEELPSGSLIHVVDRVARCLDCADLGHLVYLPQGDAALTRRASKQSKLRAVVVQWSAARKRYERRGILVEDGALEKAEAECTADARERAARRERAAEYRERREFRYVHEFARAIRELYPRCPADLATEVAEHACRKHSGRIGRTAAAKTFSAEAVDLAVRAHVRHRHTNYDDRLMAGWDRDLARQAVRDDVEQVLDDWRADEARLDSN